MDRRTIPVTQESLLAALCARIEDCATFAAGEDASADLQLVVVVASLDVAELVDLIRSACRQAAADTTRQWVANYTKCVLLAGNPQKVLPRFPELPWIQGQAAAVCGPAKAQNLSALRRLLRPLTAIPPEACLRDFAAPVLHPCHELRVATRGISLDQYLIAIVHAVAESELLLRLTKGTRLRITPVSELDHFTSGAVYHRVQKARPTDDALRLFAELLPLEPSC